MATLMLIWLILKMVLAVLATLSFVTLCIVAKQSLLSIGRLADSIRVNVLPAGNVSSKLWDALLECLRRHG